MKKLDGLAHIIHQERYAHPGELQWEDTVNRVTTYVAQAETDPVAREKFISEAKEFIGDLSIIPGGRILTNCGRPDGMLLNCISGNTKVHTKKGVLLAKDLSGEVETLSKDGVYRKAIWKDFGEQPLFRVVLSNGRTLEATAGHEWVVTRKGGPDKYVKVTTLDLVGEHIPYCTPATFEYDETEWKKGVRHGLVYGDGNVHKNRKGEVDYTVIPQFGDSSHLITDYFERWAEQKHAFVASHLPKHFKELPDETATPSYIRGFIAGFIAADGCVSRVSGNIMCHQSDIGALQKIADLAISVGLPYASIKKVRDINPFDGREGFPLYKLAFVKKGFFNANGLDTNLILKHKHRQYLQSHVIRKTPSCRVLSVEPTGKVEKVYCCTEPETHTMVIDNGILTGQCFVIDIDDSREAIGEAVKNYLIISGTGGGVGLSFKKIRPKGTPIVKSGGESSGSVSFMDVINSVADTIKIGGGRRAATMISLPAEHPDVVEFVHHKMDLGKLNNANVSVEINSKFIQAVQDDKDWDLVWAGRVVQKIKARELWDYVVKNALASGEPGFLNLELANKMSNSHYYNRLSTTNPCVTKDFTFVTPFGIRKLSDVRVGDTVWTGKSWSKLVNVWSTGVKPVYRYGLSNGTYLDMTHDHRVVSDGCKLAIGSMINNGKKLDKQDYSNEKFDLYEHTSKGDNSLLEVAELAGYLFGDDSMQKNGGVSAYINIGSKDGDAEAHFSRFTEKVVTGSGKRLLKLLPDYTFDKLKLVYAPMKEREIPEFWRCAGFQSSMLFLRGLYSANGSVITNKGKAIRIALKTSNKQVALTVQEMLESLQIHSYITTNKAKATKFSNGEYTSQESYDVNTTDVESFMCTIGFIHKYKTETALTYGECKKQIIRRPEVVSSELLGEQEVFDFTVEADEHTVAHKGLLISNCGEIFLPIFGVCCLSSINVANFVLPTGGLDLPRFREAVRVGIRLLDNVLTVNSYPLPTIKEVATSERRIGLGLTGVHTAMLKLGIKYSSRAGIAFIEHCYEELRNASYLASIDLAREKGPFQKFDPERYLESGFVKTLPASIRRKIAQFGIRNVCCNTQAPTGTTSLLAGVSSGIEPIFAPIFKRTFFSDKSSTGRKEQLVLDEEVKTQLDSGKSFTDLKHFEGAYDIPVRKHLMAQEAAQRYIDQAVSKTINLPTDYTQEQLSHDLLEYTPVLKGTTIYRAGSRGFEPLQTVEFNKDNLKAALEGGATEVVDNSCASGKCSIG